MEPSHASATRISHDMNKDEKPVPLGRLETVSKGEVGDASRIPESLRELSTDEIAALNKKLIRKMDLYILLISKFIPMMKCFVSQ
jgi:hypothetical protein